MKIFQKLLKKILQISTKIYIGNIILCGDMNAGSGSEPDFIQNDNYDIYVPVNDDYAINDLIQEKRQSQYDKIDSRGKQLLELCIATQM